MASLCKRQQCTIKGHRFRQELDSWWLKLILCVDFPRFSVSLIPPAVREIMHRTIQKLATEYTSKTSSAQDLPNSQSVFNSIKLQSLAKASLLDPPANTPNYLFGYTNSRTIVAASSPNRVLRKLFMADQDSPLDLTVKKIGDDSSNQDGVLDLSTKKKQRISSAEPSPDFSVMPVVKRQPMRTDQKCQDIDDKDGLPLRGLQDVIWENRTCSVPFKPRLAKSLLIKEELQNPKHRFLRHPSPLSLASFKTEGFLDSNQMHPLLPLEGIWKKQQLDGVLESKQVSNHLSHQKNIPLDLENHGSFTKGNSTCNSASLDILAITVKKDARNSSPVDLKIPQVKGMDLSWSSNGNNSDICNYGSVTLGSVQTDISLNRRLRAILPKQSTRAGLRSLFDGSRSQHVVTDADQTTSGPHYLTSDPEADPTVSKQPRKKRGRYRQYNTEILEEAIGVVMSGKMSVSKAQNIYGIPHSTLEYKVKERMGTLKNPPKKKLKTIMMIDRQDSAITSETQSTIAPTATSSTVQEDIL